MRVRRSSRTILLDTESRVLLFRIEDATVFRADEPSLVSCWIAPGGGLEAGESHAAAALRELWEETGMTGIALGPWVAVCEPILNWAGELVQAHDRFYLARISSTAVTLENLNAAEREVYREHRWWDVEELRASGERVVPPGLVDLLARITAGDVPPQPVRLK
jgi:8-oxo-dGTP pyrophosphatase MutT (NUDIX family)